MNRRLTGTLGLAAAAVIGSTVPAWAYWTLTSDPTSVAAAEATQLNGANVEAGRNGRSGVNAKIVIRIGAGPGAIPDRYTVFRGPDLLCFEIPSSTNCEETGSNNSGDKLYTITAYAGTNWVSAVSTCSFKNNDALPDVPSSIRCAPLVGVTSLSASSSSSGDSAFSASSENSGSKSTPTEPVLTPTAPEAMAPEPTPEPTPTADTTGPVLSAEASGEDAAWAISGVLGDAAGDLTNVQITADNGAVVGSPTVGADRHFNAGITVQVGTTTVTVTQSDAAGNTSTVTLTIERKAPAVEEPVEAPAPVEATSTEPETPEAG